MCDSGCGRPYGMHVETGHNYLGQQGSLCHLSPMLCAWLIETEPVLGTHGSATLMCTQYVIGDRTRCLCAYWITATFEHGDFISYTDS